MKEYVIVGDTDTHTDCLIYRCGTDLMTAVKIYERILKNPTKDDLFVSKGHQNIRIDSVDNSWWDNVVD